MLQDLSYNTDLGYSPKFAVNISLAVSCGICFSLVSNTATVSLSNVANRWHIITIAAVFKKRTRMKNQSFYCYDENIRPASLECGFTLIMATDDTVYKLSLQTDTYVTPSTRKVDDTTMQFRAANLSSRCGAGIYHYGGIAFPWFSSTPHKPYNEIKWNSRIEQCSDRYADAWIRSGS